MRVIVGAVMALAGFLVLAHSRATQPANTTTETVDTLNLSPSWDSVDVWGMTEAAIESQSMTQALQAPNTEANAQAFLAMIAHSEGTDRAADPYRVCYSYRHTIKDLSDHPAITGEWPGESIASLGPAYAGKISTAAGKYQIIKPTWLTCKRALDLPDFSPASQDLAALYLIKRRGALDDIQAGYIAEAIAKCRNEWASLPGGDSGQPQRQLDALLAVFSNAGGFVA